MTYSLRHIHRGLTLLCPGQGELYEVLQSGELVKVTSATYPACEIASRKFKLHGHAASTSLTNGAITIEHANSGAKDLAKYTNLGRPLLVPDYDRNGSIDKDDIAKAKAGDSVFRFWINDDNDSGDVNDSRNDRPGSGTNHDDGRVSGRGDLLDFTPVWIDFSDVFPENTPEEIRDRIKWRLKSSCVNAVWSNLKRGAAGSFLCTEDLYEFGSSLDDLAECADTASLANEVEIPENLAKVMRDDPDKGVFLIEGCSAGSDLVLIGRAADLMAEVVRHEARICVSRVESMYRFADLRGVPMTSGFKIPSKPENEWDDRPCDRDVFFTHGFRVSEPESHAWGAEVFKRLWQSGSNAHFTMFTWEGNYGGILSAFYYSQNAYQALQTGWALKVLVESIQPTASKRVLMTQSLGNMVACEALKEGLHVGQYYMFNAAVPSESVDATLQDGDEATRLKYVPSAWRGYDPRSWAANWYGFFANDVSDARGKMGWPDRFTDALGNAGEVFNYYSSGDNVFKEFAIVPSLSDGFTLATPEMYSWQKQEVLKGAVTIAGTAYGGWGFHKMPHGQAPDGSVREYVPYTSEQASAMITDGAITNNPVFNRGYVPMLNCNATEDEVFMSLAKYVPAVSSPVGGQPVLADGVSENHNLNSLTYHNGWGRDASEWQHSDMKDMAYFYVYKLYEQLIQKGNLK